MNPIVALPARDLAASIARREFACVEVISAFLSQIEEHNPRANAIVALRERDVLLAEARAQDEQIAAGVRPGPLGGLPLAVKDLAEVAGIRTTMGSLLLRDHVPQAEGIMVGRLRKAGAILIGKSNVPEFGLGSHTYNAVYGATTNAYDPTRSAGGSSGGAAVALALRMVPVADGSDFGGSLRNPAAWNNVFGLRPSIGRVPQEGAEQWIPNMGVTGPMARTVADLALLLSVQAGFDRRSPLSLETDTRSYVGPLDADVKGMRLAWLGDWNRQVPHEPAVLQVCASALPVFEDLGCIVEAAHPAMDVEPVWQAVLTLRSWLLAPKLLPLADDPAARPLLGAQALWEADNARGLSGSRIMRASEVRTAFSLRIERLFERYDFLLMPAAQTFPFPVQEHWPRQVAGREMRTYHEWMLGNLLITMTGLPSLAVPAGFSAAGLPAGIQIIGRNREELACLRMAHAYEKARASVIGRLPDALRPAARSSAAR